MNAMLAGSVVFWPKSIPCDMSAGWLAGQDAAFQCSTFDRSTLMPLTAAQSVKEVGAAQTVGTLPAIETEMAPQVHSRAATPQDQT
eukprot:4683564-Amphidinium_carterae.1